MNLETNYPIENNTPPSPAYFAPQIPKSNNKLFFIIAGIALAGLVSVGAYYLGVERTREAMNSNKEGVNLATDKNSSQNTSVPQEPLFSGQLKRLNQNLKIFKTKDDDQLNGIDNDFVYYEAGKFSRGELKDFLRIIAIRPADGPGEPLVFVLATKDFHSFVLDDPDNKTSKYPENDWQNPYYFLDKNKVTTTKIFLTEQTKEINLNREFSLYSTKYPTEIVSTNKTDKHGNKIYEAILIADFSYYQKLSSPFKNLTLYFKPYDTDTRYIDQLPQSEKDKAQLRHKYLLGETEVIAVDSTGLPLAYALTTPSNIESYKIKSAQYDIAWKTYLEQLKQYQDKQISQYPKYPDYVYLPNLGFTGAKINSNNSLKFYKSYETAIPRACATTLNSNVVDVSEADLEQIGTVFDLPLYRLKNTNHPLYTLAYRNKMDYYDQDPTMWDQVNRGIKKPSLEEYINGNPLLFVKDYWQRWVALGEFDIKEPGGCGKPVIYLYPEKETKVSVKFLSPVQLTTDIPKYGDYWQVTAYPDGSLVNLKTELTECQQLNTHKKGSEYAKNACQKNAYPYLYWAGNVFSKTYPISDKGWVIDRDNLEVFLQSKLTEIGLNEKEINDFVSYWLPEMKSKNTPFYRISFLQTNDLNVLIPMMVSPSPNTIFRIFMDYLPLTARPDKLPQPQTLNKLVRSGFTLVEWGGLKQP